MKSVISLPHSQESACVIYHKKETVYWQKFLKNFNIFFQTTTIPRKFSLPFLFRP